MSQTYKIVIAIIITALVVGGGVYFWQTNQYKQNLPKEPVVTDSQPQKQTAEVTLTKEYLASSTWGQEGLYGMTIKFNSNGTFDEGYAGETGDPGRSGQFKIQDYSVLLKVETYGGLSFEEAKETYDVSYVPDRTLTLEKSDSSILFTHFLENNGRIAYWNRSSKVPEGEARRYESYIVIATQPDLKPKINAVAKAEPIFYPEFPNYDGFDYSFMSAGCDPTCDEPGEKVHDLSEVYKGIVARTQFKDELNGVPDYWYLAKINVPWYSVVKLSGKKTATVSLAWIHGSQME